MMTVRINAKGELVNSQPCCMCVNLMKEAGIYRAYYSTDEGQICYIRLSHINSDTYTYSSKGLDQVLRGENAMGITGKFPLTRQQKSVFMSDDFVRETGTLTRSTSNDSSSSSSSSSPTRNQSPPVSPTSRASSRRTSGTSSPSSSRRSSAS